ncbi:ABC transporter ATP-binding protein [Sulfitobacter guttiformis]|uniref:Amino acid/amide ABC transporter ATP-binding protein 1 (HAAT family) n=1 Tax=Sulfitobacter guttiformis TaxID=74349 RepID=J7G294_9RHOB|nr:ABC transporter ATP-binding protein [Sulfitobacter guttiformis]AFP55384.1 branched-chain amino acid ABC transporter, ATP-binding protein LivG [Sulfitobacter guttiformis]KIN75538.1 Branched-chain amino acid ABC transporter, ATP-binding protein LivG [Sulfitobacter guttiformis KCTC 32187]RKE91049.1 amino acid/amide ABC transporter ATP-binding protein 1 (HAAT family) [Sulfitobacter guttiformis]
MTDPVLATHGLHKTFGALKATDDVSIELRQGEIHAIIGPNGAGKSTLIAQICGGLRPDAGRVELSGRDVSALDTRARTRAGIGRTFQISALAMEDTVLQNVLLGAIGAAGSPWRFFKPALGDTALREHAVEALRRVGLEDHQAVVTAELSHGQRRQLEVAVALTLTPKAFVMDEPMAGLGAEGSKTLTGFLDGLRAQAPILLVEHDMDAVFALADRISVLVYGRIIESGTVAEIRNSQAVREAYLGEGA